MLRVRNFINDESGVTAIEYALIASLIAVFIIVAVQAVGTSVAQCYSQTFSLTAAGSYYFGDYDYYNLSNVRDVLIVATPGAAVRAHRR